MRTPDAARIVCKYFIWILAACFATGQTYYSVQEVRVPGLPNLVAKSKDPSDILLTSLDIIFHDPHICCGKDSALEDSALRADSSSLQDIAAKLQGRHLLNDGRPIMVTADYWSASAINSGALIAALRNKNALLMEWNSRIYVCYGVTFRQDYDNETGMELDTIQKFLLIDTRYSGAQRETVFNRETDDWSKVQGMLYLKSAMQ